MCVSFADGIYHSMHALLACIFAHAWEVVVVRMASLFHESSYTEGIFIRGTKQQLRRGFLAWNLMLVA